MAPHESIAAYQLPAVLSTSTRAKIQEAPRSVISNWATGCGPGHGRASGRRARIR